MGKPQRIVAVREAAGHFGGGKSKEKTTHFLCQKAKIPAASRVSNFAGKGREK